MELTKEICWKLWLYNMLASTFHHGGRDAVEEDKIELEILVAIVLLLHQDGDALAIDEGKVGVGADGGCDHCDEPALCFCRYTREGRRGGVGLTRCAVA